MTCRWLLWCLFCCLPAALHKSRFIHGGAAEEISAEEHEEVSGTRVTKLPVALPSCPGTYSLSFGWTLREDRKVTRTLLTRSILCPHQTCVHMTEPSIPPGM